MIRRIPKGGFKFELNIKTETAGFTDPLTLYRIH